MNPMRVMPAVSSADIRRTAGSSVSNEVSAAEAEIENADPDRLDDIVRIGGALLSCPDAAEDGLAALSCFTGDAVRRWLEYLAGPPGRHVCAA